MVSHILRQDPPAYRTTRALVCGQTICIALAQIASWKNSRHSRHRYSSNPPCHWNRIFLHQYGRHKARYFALSSQIEQTNCRGGFCVCIFTADGNVRFAPAGCCGKNALSCYTRFTQHWIYTGSGFAYLDNSFVEIRRLFDNTPDDFALW